MYKTVFINSSIGKHGALRLVVTCNFRLYLKLGQTSVN